MTHTWSKTFAGVRGGEVQTCDLCDAVRTKHLDGQNWRIEGGATDECPGKLLDSGERIELALELLDRAERLVNDNPANGPGAPHVPGLRELREAMGVLRSGRKPLGR